MSGRTFERRVGRKAAVTAEAREEPGIQAGVERRQIPAVGSELLLHAAPFGVNKPVSVVGSLEFGATTKFGWPLPARETGIRVGGPGFRAPVAERCAGPIGSCC